MEQRNEISDKSARKNTIPLRVKTLDNNIYEFDIDYDTTIQELKAQIVVKTRIPESRQRLIHLGKLLLSNDTPNSLKLKPHATLHLVALPPSINQQIEDTLSHSSTEMPHYASLLGNILRSIHSTTGHVRQRNNYRRKKGIQGSQKWRAEVVSQCLQGIEMLIRGQKKGEVNMNQLDVFDRSFQEGQWLDVMDLQDVWQEGQVIHFVQDKVLIQYLNGRKTELIENDSKRLSFFRTHTIDTNLRPFFSPTTSIPVHEKTQDIDQILTKMKDIGQIISENLQQLQDLKKKEYNEQQIIEKSLNTEMENQRSIQELINENQCGIQSETKSDKDNMDCHSIQSLKSKENIDQYDNCSIKSFRSYLSQSNWSQYHKINDLEENITEKEEEDFTSNSSMSDSVQERELQIYRLAAQTAPMMDRFGRAMIDFSPILAQMGQNLQKYLHLSHPQSKNTSLHTNNDSQPNPSDQIYFQVPLLPNPIENSQLVVNAPISQQNIDIHIHAFMNNTLNQNNIQNQQNLNISMGSGELDEDVPSMSQTRRKGLNKATQTYSEHKQKKVSFICNDNSEEKTDFQNKRSLQQQEYKRILKKSNYTNSNIDQPQIYQKEQVIQQKKMEEKINQITKEDDIDSNLSLELTTSNQLKGLNYDKNPLLINQKIFKQNSVEDQQIVVSNDNKYFSNQEFNQTINQQFLDKKSDN